MDKSILKHCLVNAAHHNGKADFQAVLGKLLSETPELRPKIKDMMPEIKKAVEEVNSWSLKKQGTEIKKMKIKITEEKHEERKGLPPLPNVEKYKQVVMRL